MTINKIAKLLMDNFQIEKLKIIGKTFRAIIITPRGLRIGIMDWNNKYRFTRLDTYTNFFESDNNKTIKITLDILKEVL